MIFHYPQRKIKQNEIPHIEINHIPVEMVHNFNFLGLEINSTLDWKTHVNKISSKISKISGILFRLKHMLPPSILKLIYDSLISPHIN